MASMEGAVGSNGAQLAETVAKHYNELKEAGLEDRTKSRIFYQRNFNNWIKSMLIGDFLNRIKRNKGHEHQITVLDLCGGKGGDLLKWKKGNIHSLVLADIAGTSVEQAEKRYQDMQDRNRQERRPNSTFSAEFLTADCTKARLRDMFKDREMRFSLVSCQFSFHYSFESYEQADMMVRNACENLRPGGYFIGTTPDANQLVKRLRASDDMSFGNDVYRVTFQGSDKDNLPLFGAKYDFHLEGVVDCPEFLVYFPVLEKIAEKYGMQLILKLPFSDFFKKHIVDNEGRGLIGRMQALEPFPSEQDVSLMAQDGDAYKTAKQHIEKMLSEGANSRTKVGTLSEAEWEATTIYLVFAFQKLYDNTAEEPPAQTSHIPTTSTEADTDAGTAADTDAGTAADTDASTNADTAADTATNTDTDTSAANTEAATAAVSTGADNVTQTTETDTAAEASEETQESVSEGDSGRVQKRALSCERDSEEERDSKAAKTEEET